MWMGSAVAAERASAQMRDPKSRARRGIGGGEGARARGDVRQARSIIGLQRARLLNAAAGVLAEDGYEGFSAAAVCVRAGVSRRTFYEIFENREQCFAAILAEAEQRAGSVIESLRLEELAWDERIRTGLWAILCLVDSDPVLARVCLMESQHAGPAVRRERERIIAKFVDAVDQGRLQDGNTAMASRLTGEALVGAVNSVLVARLAQATPARRDDREGAGEGVRSLLGELAGMIVLPYLGVAAARRQIRLAPPDAPPLVLTEVAHGKEGVDPLAGLPVRLTYRTAMVLRAVAGLTESGTGASSREVADEAGISDQGQASKLLWRLQAHGLLENEAAGNRERGEANQWRLTSVGSRIVQNIATRATTD